MLFVSLFFILLQFPTPPLILASWLVLFLRFGLSGAIIKRTSWLIDPQADSVARGQSWLALTIGIFILLIMLFVSPFLVSLMQESESSQTSTPGEWAPSLGVLALSFFYSPIALLLTVEAWLTVLSYFGLHYFLHRLKVPTDQIQCFKITGITTLQFSGILTGLIGFGWWRSLNPPRGEALGNFSPIVLSPTAVLLTFGLVFMLFFSLNKILVVEENTEQHQHIARRMVLVLITTLLLLSLVGGGLSFLTHYNREPWPSIGP